MATVSLTASADADIAAIISDLAVKAGIRIAERYAYEFEALFDRLRNYPGIGPRRPKLGPDTRIGIVAPYIAIYEFRDEMVTILRVVHGSRNITARLIRS